MLAVDSDSVVGHRAVTSGSGQGCSDLRLAMVATFHRRNHAAATTDSGDSQSESQTFKISLKC